MPCREQRKQNHFLYAATGFLTHILASVLVRVVREFADLSSHSFAIFGRCETPLASLLKHYLSQGIAHRNIATVPAILNNGGLFRIPLSARSCLLSLARTGGSGSGNLHMRVGLFYRL
jgi:hypothetical protein